MSYHIINIDAADCSVSVKKGQLICRSLALEEQSLPVEDVAALILTSYSAKLHSNLFVECARHGIPLIFCDNFKPVSLMLPANRSSDTLLTKASLVLDKKKQAALWRKTVDAKCRNQFSLADYLYPGFDKRDRFMAEAKGRSAHKESTCAQYYWRCWGIAIEDFEFKRHAPLSPSNSLLNYGYAVLLSTVLQKLFACGLDPTFGISHAVRERSAPLAYDLMEPFRPLVDWRVAQWLIDDYSGSDPPEVNRLFKEWVTGFVNEEVCYLTAQMPVKNCIEAFIRSFRRAVMQQSVREYKPWTLPSLKWVG